MMSSDIGHQAPDVLVQMNAEKGFGIRSQNCFANNLLMIRMIDFFISNLDCLRSKAFIANPPQHKLQLVEPSGICGVSRFEHKPHVGVSLILSADFSCRLTHHFFFGGLTGCCVLRPCGPGLRYGIYDFEDSGYIIHLDSATMLQRYGTKCNQIHPKFSVWLQNCLNSHQVCPAYVIFFWAVSRFLPSLCDSVHKFHGRPCQYGASCTCTCTG